MQSIGTKNTIVLTGLVASVDTTFQDIMTIPLAAGQKLQGKLYIPHYSSGGGGFKAQVITDSPAAQYVVAVGPTEYFTNTPGEFTGIGASVLIHNHVEVYIEAILATTVRIQFAQASLDAANPTYVFNGTTFEYQFL